MKALTSRRILVVAGCLLGALFTTGALGEAPKASAPKHQIITLSNYGSGSDFTIIQAEPLRLKPGETVTFVTDDPGELILRLGDNGRVFRSKTGEITFTAEQLAGIKTVRCSLLTPENVLLGWEATHEAKYGLNPNMPPDPGGGN